MSELRHDLLARRWVIIASERSRRPNEFVVHRETPTTPQACPFCPGNEAHTPKEILRVSPHVESSGGQGWGIRVFPNKYPALAIEGDIERKAVGIYDRQRGVGAHEVIVDTPEHDADLADMDAVHIERLLGVYQERLRDLYKDPRFKYALIFKNHGAAAGATLQHPHTQIIATPVTPRAIAIELQLSREHFYHKTRCMYCDILNQELETGDRVVALDEHYAVITPYASRFPFETMVIPRRHGHSFAEEPRGSLPAMGRRLKDLFTRLKSVLRDPPYNFVLHTAPNIEARGRRGDYWYTLKDDFHWHLEVLPRLTQVAGFEWGTGLFINPTAPEDAAGYLRDAAV